MKKITIVAILVAFSTMAMAVGMSGVYKVGVAEVDPNFTSLSAAVTAVNTLGLAGNVVLEITSDITETVNIGLINASDFTLTIRPDQDVDRTITFDKATDNAGPSGALCIGIGMGLAWADLAASKNVVIDGYAVGGTTRRLKIATSSLHHGGNGPILVINDCSNIQLKNLIIHHVGASSALGNYGIYIRANTLYGVNKMPSNVLIENNDITVTQNTASQGIGTFANAAPGAQATGIVIKKNIIKARTRGIFLNYTTDIEIAENTFSINQTAGSVLSSAIMGNAGLAGNVNVFANRFIELKTANGAAGAFGMRAIIASGGGIWNISNNFFTGFAKTTATAGETMLQGIRCGSTTNIRNNTFYLNALPNKPTYVETPGESTAAYCAINIAAGTPVIKNNIFVSDENTVYNFFIRGTVTGDSDYNIMHLKAGNDFARYNMNFNVAYANFVDFQDAYADKDNNSKSVAVEFVDAAAGNLLLAGASIQDANLAVPRLPEVLKDILGTDRAESTYAGAHESTLPFITTSNPSVEQTARILRTPSGVMIELDAEALVEIYTVNGMKLESVRASGTYSKDLENGLYIIRINGSATKFLK
jgi:hypothetical protein